MRCVFVYSLHTLLADAASQDAGHAPEDQRRTNSSPALGGSPAARDAGRAASVAVGLRNSLSFPSC